ncbi:Hsp70 protein [Hokovirus HKV1]|uniref:Hsp70 protein n=1 Tax=Hokovirus HKV1 TaxID=1977638 RepID=A0A1V0SG59_9VIRU|nr:Hsp70 protein [Hokovirus HKV1]
MKYSIGIDFGTCNSIISIFQNDNYISVQDQGNHIIPTCVYINDNVNLCGIAAIPYNHSTDYIQQFKRLIGKNKTEINNIQKQLGYKINVNDSIITIETKNKIEYNLEDIITLYINHLKTLIIKHLTITDKYPENLNDNPLIITVPAYFNEVQRSLIIKSFTNVGFNFVYLLNEPTSAAYYYINNYNDILNSIVLVFDIGGGTTDLTLLYIDTENNVMQVIGTFGDCNFGGQDFSKQLLIYVLKYLKNNNINISNIVNNNKLIENILEACDNAKKILSNTDENVYINFYILEKEFNILINNTIYNELCQDLFKKCENMFDKIINDSNINKNDIKHILLIGGPVKMPELKNTIKNYFNTSKIYDNFDPKLIVSQGAALYNYNNHIKPKTIHSQSNNDIVLVDVTPLSLGIKTVSGNELLIEKNTNIPCSKFKTFSTYYDNQRIINIDIVQGYDNELTNYRIIGNIQLTNIPAMPKKEPRIVVKFYIDKSGLLTVSVIEENSNIKNCLVLHV